jgi:hypothetical protein
MEPDSYGKSQCRIQLQDMGGCILPGYRKGLFLGFESLESLRIQIFLAMEGLKITFVYQIEINENVTCPSHDNNIAD